MASHYVRSSDYPLQVHHVVKMLGVSPRTVRYWAKSGKLEGIKNGPKIWCFRREDVERCRRVSIGVVTRSADAAFNPASTAEVTHHA
jgi:excisionase family DNA binding protein